MRFATLSLEKYGHFEDRILEFRSGTSDLHLIYGANEAGKSTSMAAVTDLLFGIPMRSPFNFRFDYPLLRIGALLEEDGGQIAVRRRKGGSGTLVDADDKPMDEAPLLGMLRGQTRETFGRSFSLDQGALREGGEAMVKAKDDAGQALFAAGSNLTAVASVLAALEEDADGIWGKRAKASRTYTAAERALEASLRTVRDASLKPKAWSDARAASEEAHSALKQLESQRLALKRELRSLDRLRGVASLVETRAATLQELAEHADAVVVGEQIEAQARECLDALERAQRDRATAKRLRSEAEDRLGAVEMDDAVLAASDEIENLLERRGAEAKASEDLPRLTAKREQLESRIADLQKEFGSKVSVVPTRTQVAELRQALKAVLAARDGAEEAKLELEDVKAQLARLDERLAKIPADETLPTLAAAVDAARQLGADFDQRCAAAADAERRAAARRDALLSQLKPWSGSLDELVVLPPLSDHELQQARDRIAELETALREASTTAVRLRDEAETLALQIERVSAAEGAVTSDALTAARRERDADWTFIRERLTAETVVEDGVRRAAAFGELVEKADALADRRYTSAEASGRLAEMVDLRDRRLLEAEQASRAIAEAEAELSSFKREWEERLTRAGLPILSPLALDAWQTARSEVIEASEVVSDAAGEAERARSRRQGALIPLCRALGIQIPEDPTIAPVLTAAEAARAAREERALSRREIEQEIGRLADEADTLARAMASRKAEEQRGLAGWKDASDRAGVDLSVEGAELRFDIIDELRSATEELAALSTRIAGIERDASSFRSAVANLAGKLGCATPNGGDPLEVLKSRLTKAGASSAQAQALKAEVSRRGAEEAEATAKSDAARSGLADVMKQLGAEDTDLLPDRLDASAQVRALRGKVRELEAGIVAKGDGYGLEQLLEALAVTTPDEIGSRREQASLESDTLDDLISDAARTYGDARRRFEDLDVDGHSAADAQADAEAARAEMAVQAEAYLMKRTQAVMLRWAIEKYRKRHQDPLLARASTIFETLTLGRYKGLDADMQDSTPRLIGLCEDGKTVVEVGQMSEGTTDQLFLALRIAALEQSVDAGVRLPFLADDLFVNFDDDRARAGFRVLADLSRSTQVLFFTHHEHLAAIAQEVLGCDGCSEVRLA